jgi:hypothetical protein
MRAFSHVFPPDDGGSTYLRNVGKFLPRSAALPISTDARTSHFPRELYSVLSLIALWGIVYPVQELLGDVPHQANTY